MNKVFQAYLRGLLVAVISVLCFVGAVAANNYVVVIDAGHGGKDHGAIDNNVREKDINLGVALKLGNLIKKNNKNVKVVYTRDKDEYLTLQQRASIANKSKGDLFISIHTNSVDKTNPNRASVAGASTYTLGRNKGDSNMDVARRENSVMTLEDNFETKYKGFDPNSDESYIIFEMAQKANMSQSVKFANEVQKQLTNTAKRKNRGVRQAGFWVLWATSMPSVLVELDFICNPNSAKYLASDSGQKQLAQGISNAVNNYFKALAQHNKNRLKAEVDKDSDDAGTGFSADAEGVMLASSMPKSERKTTGVAMPVERTRRPGARRRRSDASREKSERQQYAVAVIPEEEVYVDNSQLKPVQEEVAQVAEPVKNKAEGKKKTSVSKKVSSGGSKKMKVNMASSVKKSAKSDTGKALASNSSKNKKGKNRVKNSDGQDLRKTPARLQKMATVYKIQILSSSELLKANNTLFCGLSPVTCIKEGGEYKYVYGESTNRNEIYQMLADVQKNIPDAVVIKVRKGISPE